MARGDLREIVAALLENAFRRLRHVLEIEDRDRPFFTIDRLRFHGREHRGEALKVGLLPLLGLVVVALRALNLHTEKDTRHVAREVLRLTGASEDEVHRGVHAGCSLFFGALDAPVERVGAPRSAEAVLAGGRDELAHHSIPRSLFGETKLEPALERAPIGVLSLRSRPHQDRVPNPRQVRRVLGAREQPIDELRSLRRRRVGEERADLGARRNASDQIEAHASQVRGVIDGRAFGEPALFPCRGEDEIERGVGRSWFRGPLPADSTWPAPATSRSSIRPTQRGPPPERASRRDRESTDGSSKDFHRKPDASVDRMKSARFHGCSERGCGAIVALGQVACGRCSADRA